MARPHETREIKAWWHLALAWDEMKEIEGWQRLALAWNTEKQRKGEVERCHKGEVEHRKVHGMAGDGDLGKWLEAANGCGWGLSRWFSRDPPPPVWFPPSHGPTCFSSFRKLTMGERQK